MPHRFLYLCYTVLHVFVKIGNWYSERGYVELNPIKHRGDTPQDPYIVTLVLVRIKKCFCSTIFFHISFK